ncbi:MAG: sigma-70 family RNA polymerase sigma factor [Bacteroidales bacterium]|nr:sigma-70 family RNA polymerase sigma factor [Bacteroidales bacterium]MBP3662680.1 sigma-70 family RNA polymerase sigma factor [Bacteroidales bacterium]
MKQGFAAILVQTFSFNSLTNEDIEDIFQESCIVLMQKVKSGGIAISRDGALFSYLVQIGKLTACNLVRKRKDITTENVVTISDNLHKEYEDISVDEKQKSQDEFLDRVFDSLPSDCKTLLKHFYWGRKPMDHIASVLGMRNADSAKTKKNKCMNKFKDIAAKLIESDEFAEEAVRAAVERAALKELLENEKVYAENGICTAALNTDDTEE